MLNDALLNPRSHIGMQRVLRREHSNMRISMLQVHDPTRSHFAATHQQHGLTAHLPRDTQTATRRSHRGRCHESTQVPPLS